MMVNSNASNHALGSALFVAEARGNYRVATELELLDAAEQVLLAKVRRGPFLKNVIAVRNYLRVRMGHLEHEEFAVLYLDAQHRLLDMENLFRGTLAATTVYTRDVVKQALDRGAAAVILVHNHPSGSAEPSRADIRLTEAIKAALALVEVRLLDHFVVTRSEAISMAESGLL